MPEAPPPFRRAAWLAAVVLGLLVRGAGAEPTRAVEIPSGIPVTLDGVVQPGEWDDARVCSLGVDDPRLRVKQSRETLVLAVTSSRPWPRRGHLLLYASPRTEDGSWTAPGTVVVDFEPFDHNRPHALVRRRSQNGWDRVDGQAVFRTSDLDAAASVEGAISLGLLGITSKASELRWLVGWTMPGRQPSHVTFPEGLDIGATGGGAPKDLATTARWALSTSFPGAGGPSAFSKSDWDAYVAADAELTGKGERAHTLALERMGEIGTGSGEEKPKHDAELQDGVIAPLRWIAAHERLTHADLRAWATALWRLNRADEGLALLDAAVTVDPTDEGPDDERLAAMLATDAERYEEAAAHWDRVAALLPPRMGPPYVGAARTMREQGALFAAETAARAQDAEKDDQPLARLRTSKGDVLIRLLEDDVPTYVAQFVHLAEAAKTEDGKPFYAGTLFHRVVANGVVQGGDPKSRTEGCEAAGGGGSSWWIPTEKNPRHSFFRGSVGFAMGADNKVRSQFFIMTAPKPRLSSIGFACFGTVVAGMDVVDRIEACDVLYSVTILRKRDHPYEPKKNY